MLENILKLSGIKVLNTIEKKSVQGGKAQCKMGGVCIEYGLQCYETECQMLP